MTRDRSVQMTVLLILAFSAMTLFGCDQGTSGTTSNKNYYTGIKGVEMSFMPGLPPNTMYEGDKFEAVIEMRNLGTYPEEGAPEGKLYISGFDDQAIKGYWENLDIFPDSFQGISPINPTGGYATKVYV